ncbi:MAG TPA: hypothetical protein VHR72_04195 [Gemmataceae bacterium]|jgi:hypothetical protein|nr:hypothetical protein [Gemmataceae bacterium]
MGIFYHYSPLFHLPPIVREGLSIGEIALPNLQDRKTAVSLTSQTDHDRLYFWGSSVSVPFKTAVRYVCHLDASDNKVESARSVWKRLDVSSRILKKLDPNGQSKWWYFYHGVIPPERFAVELWGRHGYVPTTRDQLARIAAEVDNLRNKFELIVPPKEPWALDVRLKDESDKSPLWVLNEACPADRYLDDPS